VKTKTSDEQVLETTEPVVEEEPTTAEVTDTVLVKNISTDHLYFDSGCVYPGQTALVNAKEIAKYVDELELQ
jgi:hypothetical protein